STSAVIVDLRDSAGGSPAMVGYLVSYFVPKNSDIYNTFKSRQGDSDERPPAKIPTPPRSDIPLVVLTSGRSASAAESFAHTLQSAKRARIVGERSAGAANPTALFPIDGGFEVTISVGEPINPITHRNWEGTGVVPDTEVPVPQALTEAQKIALTSL